MKRPIYLDERERDLARRVILRVKESLSAVLKKTPGITYPNVRLAAEWTRDELGDLYAKFQEPEDPQP